MIMAHPVDIWQSIGWKDSGDRNIIKQTMTMTNALQGMNTFQFGLDRTTGRPAGDVSGAMKYATIRENLVRSSMMTLDEQRKDQVSREGGANIPLIKPTDMTGEKWDMLQQYRMQIRQENLRDFGYDTDPHLQSNTLSPLAIQRLQALESGATRPDNNAVAGAIVEELKKAHAAAQINALAITNNNQSTVVAGDIADQNSLYDRSRKENFSNANHGGGNIHQFHP